MGLDITFYKTKDIYKDVTPVVYQDDNCLIKKKKDSIILEDFEKLVTEIYYLRNNWVVLNYLAGEYGQIKYDPDSFYQRNELNDCIVNMKESDIPNIESLMKENKHWTDEEQTDFIYILKKSIVRNSVLIHISY